jgi:hypothetical protein
MLPLRWRLDQHPLFHTAQVRLGRAAPIERPIGDRLQDGLVVASANHVQYDAFIQMSVPDCERARYRLMMDKFKEVIALSGDPASCKLTMLWMNERIAQGKGTRLAGGFASIQAPVRKGKSKRGRPSNDDIENRSRLSAKRHAIKPSKKCSVCSALGITATDHRKGGRCPNIKNWIQRGT